MTIFGKPLSDYVAFCKVFIILIPLVGIIRLAISLSGTPNSTAQFLSMTVLAWVALVYYSIRIHTIGFGSYKQLLVICVLLNLSMQIVSIAGILISIVTGANNIFSSPEFAFGQENKWLHLGAHFVIGIPVGSLVPWLIGSLILAVTRKVAQVPPHTGNSSISA